MFFQYLDERHKAMLVKKVLILALLLNVFVVALIAYYAVSAVKLAHTRDPSAPVRQISVSGEGKAAVKPDSAVFSATVITQSAKVKDAQNKNSSASNAIFAFLKQNGIAEKDTKTIQYSVEPQYEFVRSSAAATIPAQSAFYPMPYPPPPPSSVPKIASYQVRYTFEIKVHDLNKADTLLDGVVAQGANEVGSLSFRVDNEDQVKADAQKKAIDNAQQKANQLARNLGVRLGRIVLFSESGNYPIYYSDMAKSAEGGVSSAPAPRVAPGEQEVTSTVNINYEFW